MGWKVITNKVITLHLVTENVVFTQQCFILPITNPIILGSDFLDTHFAVLDIGDYTITFGYADYTLTTSLTHNLVHDQFREKIVTLAAIKVLYK